MLALRTSRIQRWTPWITLIVSIPPFLTVWLAHWAQRSGRLDPVRPPAVAVAD